MLIYLQIPCPHLTLCNPPLQQLGIPGLKPNLEGLRLRGQRSRNSITLDSIENGSILLLTGRMHSESSDEADVRRVELAVREMRTGTHARAGAVAVVRSSRAIAKIEVAFGEELGGDFEVVFVVVGGPGILFF